ncbi:MAG TPA: PIN domain-containing protein [Candidatus Angelobacter sp.]|jgi:PIN domain nuclease of toxin-antitoxin system|nr:PIN domain-containing protein [Candidatus Angelobacter sp.]
MLNLDTHILIYALEGKLKTAEERILRTDNWGISAVVLWELTKLFQLKRISLDIRSAEFSRGLSRIHVWPIDLVVCREILGLDFQSDPADEIIAATSITHKVPLVTRDSRILGSKLVPIAK